MKLGVKNAYLARYVNIPDFFMSFSIISQR